MVDFSVVIPAFNASRTIGSALESCLGQSYLPKDVVVVDDGSVDATVDVVREFGQRIAESPTKVNLVTQIANRGPAAARNVGIENAAGNWIAFLDSDDTWEPRKLEIVAEAIERHPNAVLVGHRYRYAYKTRRKNGSLDFRTVCVRRVSLFRLLLGNFLQTSCVAFRKSNGKRFNEAMKYSEDYALWLAITATDQVIFLEKELTTLWRSQLAPGGLSGRRNLMRLGEMRAYFEVARVRNDVVFLLPLLLTYSVLRHLYSTVRYIIGFGPR